MDALKIHESKRKNENNTYSLTKEQYDPEHPGRRDIIRLHWIGDLNELHKNN